MKVAQDKVVSIHYTLKDDSGQVLDQSAADEPLAYLHGNGNLVPGLEKALEGKQAGDKVSVAVAPAEGYGERDERMVQTVPRDAFRGVEAILPGMRFNAQSDHGVHTVVVTKVERDTVTVDGNHPLAGQTLHFEVEVGEVREPSAEELDHGHVHGPGGHHH